MYMYICIYVYMYICIYTYMSSSRDHPYVRTRTHIWDPGYRVRD